MADRTEYRFKIDVFTPDTLSMKRLAEYMLEVAQLLGEYEHVHFIAVAKGSAEIVHAVDYVAVPKVRDRVRSAMMPIAPDDLARRRAAIDKMLALDNAVGVLQEVGHKSLVLRFPGRELLAEEITGITEDGAIQGQLVRIGGFDKTAHALIENSEGTHTCEMARDLARTLAPHLYGPPIRIEGRGRWRRTREGKWELQSFRASRYEVLSEESLGEGIERLRKANEGGKLIVDGTTADDLLKIRQRT